MSSSTGRISYIHKLKEGVGFVTATAQKIGPGPEIFRQKLIFHLFKANT
jgi:hypothetical protein